MRSVLTGMLISASLALFSLPSQSNASDADASIEASPVVSISPATELTVSGFGDLIAATRDSEEEELFNVGQAEIDLESEISDRTTVALAIAYDADRFGIGAFTLEYVAWEAPRTSSSAPMGLKSLALGIGQFDVPFGIDWYVYASIDRKLVTAPSVVAATHDSWNDYGGYVTVEAERANLTAFATNGFCVEGESPDGSEFESCNDFAVGGRLGIVPLGFLEIGGSLASVVGSGDSYDMWLIGGDLQMNLGPLTFKGEYIRHDFVDGPSENFAHDGFYLESSGSSGPWFAVTRYDRFTPVAGSDRETFLSTGAGRSIDRLWEIRTEYRYDIEHERSNLFLQAAVSF